MKNQPEKQKWEQVHHGESVFELGEGGEMKPVSEKREVGKEKKDVLTQLSEEAEVYAKSKAMAARNKEEYDQMYKDAYQEYLREHSPRKKKEEDLEIEELPLTPIDRQDNTPKKAA